MVQQLTWQDVLELAHVVSRHKINLNTYKFHMSTWDNSMAMYPERMDVKNYVQVSVI